MSSMIVEHLEPRAAGNLPPCQASPLAAPRATRRLIVTADDFGLAPEINRGIIDGHRRGVVTSTSLLVNAPATEEAVEAALRCPGLEVGLHLSVVEGISLRGVPSTLTDPLRYLDRRLCLHRHWRPFLARYLAGRIDLGELEEELGLQIERFLTFYPSIPFVNGTQHLHLLPGVLEIVLRLADLYRIAALRVVHPPRPPRLGSRSAAEVVLDSLGRRARRRLRGRRPATTDFCSGFRESGRLNAARLHRLVLELPPGTTELITHPGHECRRLREELPWGYRRFSWQQELEALTDDDVRDLLDARGVALTRFAELPSDSPIQEAA